ncbi:hypothetical protein C8J33_1316 [Rhizobium sp. PP-CC-3G-465]|nr:hypothetical protein C8J33_1316 [Rhizobium sp. PP-CC-3G-465]
MVALIQTLVVTKYLSFDTSRTPPVSASRVRIPEQDLTDRHSRSYPG